MSAGNEFGWRDLYSDRGRSFDRKRLNFFRQRLFIPSYLCLRTGAVCPGGFPELDTHGTRYRDRDLIRDRRTAVYAFSGRSEERRDRQGSYEVVGRGIDCRSVGSHRYPADQ